MCISFERISFRSKSDMMLYEILYAVRQQEYDCIIPIYKYFKKLISTLKIRLDKILKIYIKKMYCESK